MNDFDGLIRLKWRRWLAERRRTVIKSRIEETEMQISQNCFIFKDLESGPH